MILSEYRKLSVSFGRTRGSAPTETAFFAQPPTTPNPNMPQHPRPLLYSDFTSFSQFGPRSWVVGSLRKRPRQHGHPYPCFAWPTSCRSSFAAFADNPTLLLAYRRQFRIYRKSSSESAAMNTVMAVTIVRDSVWLIERLRISIGSARRLRKFSRTRSNTTILSLIE